LRLVIKPKDEDDRQGRKGRKLTGNDYNFLLTNKQGDEIDVTNPLVSVNLTMGLKEANSASMTFLLDDIDVDAEFIAELQAHIETKEAEDAVASARDS
jgi:hypothetical protein